jgi:hypothetical protein
MPIVDVCGGGLSANFSVTLIVLLFEKIVFENLGGDLDSTGCFEAKVACRG